MRRGRRLGLGICGVMIAAACAAPAAHAATAVGDYRFNDTLGPSFGLGPTLTTLGTGANSYSTDSVMGSTQRVLNFPKNNGFQMSPVGTGGDLGYTVVMTFKFAEVSGYRRILDKRNNTSDEGLYVRDGKLSWYTGGPTDSVAALISPNTWATVAFTSNHPELGSTVYFNGGPVVGSSIGGPLVADTLRFFRDSDAGTPNEASAGSVACIRVFKEQLTDQEVALIGANPTCGGPPLPVKKCKKKKKSKKRSAASAKKKRKKCGKKPKKR